MFGGAKPSFGAGAGATGFGAFSNTAAATPFGQSAFGKPATPAFGGTPAFGAQPAQPSMFGSAAAPNQTTGGLFGSATTTSAFGSTTAAPTSFGAFSQAPQQTSSIFGSTQAAPNTSLFGQTATSAFGAAKPTTLGMTSFGQTPAAQPLFGQQQTVASSASGFGSFGQTAPTTTNVFGSGAASAFGQPQAVTVGAAGGVNAGTSLVKYQPTIGTDTLMKGGQTNNVNTKQHCITAMKEYELKSLEELRLEDYMSGRKGPQAGSAPGAFGFGSPTAGTQATAGGGLFGSPSQQQQQHSAGLFGQTGQENKSLFGSSAFGQQAPGSAFGAPAQQNNFMQKPFGAAPTSAFGTTTTDAANPFGAKPVGFGQTGSNMFGQATATNAAPAFGQTTTTFGGFGSTAGPTAQQTPLFGATNPTDPNKPAFGLGTAASTAQPGFGGFGSTATSTAGGGLFGSKPATSFAAPAFGASSTANTAFGNFTLSNSNAPGAGGGLFNTNLNKPPTSAFGGFGTTSSAPLNFNASNTGNSIFSSAAKPGGLFGGGNTTLGTGTGAAPTGGGLFGAGGANGGFGSTLGGSFGSLGGGNTALSGLGLGASPAQGVVVVPIHQQILSKVTSPYGDTPIFRDLKRNEEVDATRATNPVAQQAMIDMNSHHYKITEKEGPAGIRVKALVSARNTKSMFDGLEEFDASVEGFSLKPNAKRLVIKPRPKTTTTSEPSSIQHQGNSGSGSPAPAAVRPPTKSYNGITPNEPVPISVTNSSPVANRADADSSRRESWLHPNNLAKVRQHNLQSGMDQSPLNSTVTDLVPRKPLETYKNAAPAARLSVSTIPENPFEDQASSIARRDTFISEHGNESSLSIRSNDSEQQQQRLAIEPAADADPNPDADTEPHPTGIVLRRVGYYTIPQLDDLKSYLAEDGSCVVPDFTVGREGYGNVYFGKELDVAGLNLDEIVHFRNKEVIIYPDDDNKPPIGSGLNREAQVTLDQVWPVDKTKHEAIKDPQRLLEMDWEAKLRRVCDKNATRFIEFRPETGSWVFRVKHFSKYGLADSDEEDDEIPTDPKKAKMGAMEATTSTDKMTLTSLRKAQKISEEAGRTMDPKSLDVVCVAGGFRPMDTSAEFLMMDKTQFFQAGGGTDFSMFDAPRPVAASPPAALSHEFMGSEPHKMQLMKSSLFVEDNGSDDELDSFPLRGRRQQQQQKLRTHNLFGQDTQMWKDAVASENSSEYGRQSPLLAVSSSNSVNSIIRELQSETSSVAAESVNPAEKNAQPTQLLGALKAFNVVIKPRVAPEKVFASVVPLSRSIAHGLYNGWIADLGFYKGRSFKLSFGPQNTLMVPNTFNNLCSLRESGKATPAAIAFEARVANDYSPNLMQRLQFNTVDKYEHFGDTILPHLEVQLQDCSIRQVEGSNCPWLQSNNGTQLIAKHLAAAIRLSKASSMDAYGVSVWSLMISLWGEHEELVGQDSSSHFVVMCRRNLLSEWLENALVSKDLLSKKVANNSYLAHMLDLLSCHRVTEACELAFKYDDANLALILAQLSSGAVVRMLMEEQLFAWQQSKSDKYISLERIKMFMLAAGVPQMQSSHGAINLLEDCSWLTVLALQLWYLTAPTSSITDALLEYDKSFQAEESYADPPKPNYKAKQPYKSQQSIYDLRYHLLQLYSKRGHSLEQTLNPITHTSDPMDFRLSWMLLQTLEALGYHHCTPLAEAQLHVDFASQLENEDLWQWAIFVQLHIKDRNQRERAVQHTLQQHVSVSAETLTAEEEFIIEQLGVPESWVDYAKAVKAGSMGRRHAQAKYLLKAKHWVQAHEIIFQYIAPDAIINNNLEYLNSLLSQFECTDDGGVKVPNWTNQGQIFLDFIDISAKFGQIHNVTSNSEMLARWENLKPQLSEICSRISLLPCPTSKHRLCQTEISKCLTCLVHGIRIVWEEFDSCYVIEMALDRLPMPQEFITKEHSNLLEEFMQNMLNHQSQESESKSEPAPRMIIQN
ncbi:nuclear pore complex protein Nup98-Nup96 [Drosophila grimshawi]|uniref:Nuclear pore complex protein Nup98-Nup96 n=1 Tax=Drosophila grimshawi TaxID=7222 RepID=B4JTA2_DROGR|nr:nuclear pore complex protein Nup98-Nup96 [Drosophila grimshawi]EDV94992.1 GH10992 [Drosophila grimshawi]